MSNEPQAQRAAHEVLLANSRSELIIGSVAAALIAAMIWADSKAIAVLAWLAVIQSIYGIRFFVARSLMEQSEQPQEKIVSRLRIGLMATGLMWGLGVAGNIVMLGMVWPTIVSLVTVAVLSIMVLGTYLGQKTLVLPFVFITS